MIHHGDCVEVMAGMEPESVDAIVTDPPYGLEFMGKEWDRLKPTVRANRGGRAVLGRSSVDAAKLAPVEYGHAPRRSTYTCDGCGKRDKFKNAHACEATWSPLRLDDDTTAYARTMQDWHTRWATEALRVARPGAYLLAFGGTRTAHRLAVAIEDAGWVIRDTLMWVYASGFPKSRALLKPAYEPIVMARKPGPLRELDIEGCRIEAEPWTKRDGEAGAGFKTGKFMGAAGIGEPTMAAGGTRESAAGRWPANLILTDPVFDGGWDGVVGGGNVGSQRVRISDDEGRADESQYRMKPTLGTVRDFGDTGTYSRFFLIPKASRRDREPSAEAAERLTHTLDGGVWGGAEDDLTPGKKRTIARVNTHPTVKPTALMRHLVRLVTPQGGVVLDPFLGSGSTAKAAILEGFEWVGIEQSAEYIAIAEARIDGLTPEPTQMEMSA